MHYAYMSTQLFSLHDAMTFLHSKVQSTTKASVNDHMDHLFHYMVTRLKVSTNALAWRIHEQNTCSDVP
jgi:hypothetical protein